MATAIARRNPFGKAGEIAEAILGELPLPTATTVGPGSVPLGDSEGYIRRVLKAILDDLADVRNRPTTQLPPVAKVVRRAATDIDEPLAGTAIPDTPSVERLTRSGPGAGLARSLVAAGNTAENNQALLQKLVNIVGDIGLPAAGVAALGSTASAAQAERPSQGRTLLARTTAPPPPTLPSQSIGTGQGQLPPATSGIDTSNLAVVRWEDVEIPTPTSPAGASSSSPTFAQQLKAGLPEIVGLGVGLVPHPAAKIAAPLAAGATTAIRDALDPEADVNLEAIVGHTIANAIPGFADDALRAGGAMIGGIKGALMRAMGQSTRAAKPATTAGAQMVARGAAGASSPFADMTLPGGIKLLSPDGHRALVQRSIDLTNQGAPAHLVRQVDDLAAAVLKDLRKLQAQPTSILQRAGMPATTPPAPRSPREFDSVGAALRAILAAGSVAGGGHSATVNPRPERTGGR